MIMWRVSYIPKLDDDEHDRGLSLYVPFEVGAMTIVKSVVR